MSEVENILYKAYKNNIYEQTISIAQDIKKENPMMEVGDRYELAYEKANNKRKAFPPID